MEMPTIEVPVKLIVEDEHAELVAAHKYIAKLEERLKRFGQHKADCNHILSAARFAVQAMCNCGFSEPLKAASAEDVVAEIQRMDETQAANVQLRGALKRMQAAIEVLNVEARVISD